MRHGNAQPRGLRKVRVTGRDDLGEVIDEARASDQLGLCIA